jgi:hypothetical protein
MRLAVPVPHQPETRPERRTSIGLELRIGG